MRKWAYCYIFLLILGTALSSSNNLVMNQLQDQDEFSTRTNVTAPIEQLIMGSFYENLGQIKSDFAYYGVLPGARIGFSNSSIELIPDTSTSAIQLTFPDSTIVRPSGLAEQEYRTHFLLGDRGTYQNVKTFASIEYNDIWPGIDLIYYGTQSGVKYEFHVDAGVDPSIIRMNYVNIDAIQSDGDSVRITTASQTFVDEGLVAFQGTTPVDVEFILSDPMTLAFKLGEYDNTRELVIDPLIYSTFVGGNNDDYCDGIAIDPNGNAYVTGHTASLDFPTSPGAYDLSRGGNSDIFVTKLNATGNGILYSTYIGGSDDDWGYEIAVDTAGCAYVTGHTWSADFPRVNPYASVFQGFENFVLKLNETGSALLYSTYVGGYAHDNAYAIAIDLEGNAYVAGASISDDFPMVNPYNSTYAGGNRDCIVYKLNSTGNGLIYSTFIGGSDKDEAYDIAVSSTGDAWIVGRTVSPNFPTQDGFDSTQVESEGFLCRLNSTGSGLTYSSLIGGSHWDEAEGISIDTNDDVYVTGWTRSTDFPIVNAYDSTFDGLYDAFILKVDADTGDLVYSTYLGGTGEDRGHSIFADSEGHAYVTGFTYHNSFPTVNAYDSTINGGTDVFVTKIDESGGSLFYSTFIGGSSSDNARSIVVDSDGYAFVGGNTYSSNFPRVNAYDSTHNTDWDTFVLKLPDMGDSDIDALSDYTEHLIGTDRHNNDTDLDLMPDGWEVNNLLDPLLNDSWSDFDNDNLVNLFEYGNNTLAFNNDTDSDFLLDGDELSLYSSNPLNNDTDFDLLLDYDEVFIHGTLPNNNDTDFDLMPDGWEVFNGLNATFDDASLDLDSDELTNYLELVHGTLPNNNDTDFDLMPDGWEVFNGLNATFDDASLDLDSDELTNYLELVHGTLPNNNDTDHDSLNDASEIFVYFTDPTNNDTDSDLMPDGWEVANGLDPLLDDADNDFDTDDLTNILEWVTGTFANNSDSDSDLMSDGWEVSHGLNPLMDDSGDDPDRDTLTNYEEYTLGTNPQNSDTDSDMMRDDWEHSYGLNPLVADSELDNDSDLLTNLEEYNLGTNPINADSDADTMPDGWEVSNNLNPLVDDSMNDLDLDDLPNIYEWLNGTLANNSDSDSDLMPDGWEVSYGLDPNLDDSTNDPDEDNYTNLEEYLNGTNPFVFDGTGDPMVLILIGVGGIAIVVALGLFFIKIRSGK